VQTTFDADDGRILSYLRRGSGPLVVCVPGGPGMDPEAYFAAMDLPGYELLIFGPAARVRRLRRRPPMATTSLGMSRIWRACASISASTL